MRKEAKSIQRAFLRLHKEDSLREQDGKCLYCLDGLTYSKSTVEHKVAKSKGGSNSKENIGASCPRCNRDKGSLSHSEYLKILDGGPDVRRMTRTSIWMSRRLNTKLAKSLKKFNKYVKDLNDGARKQTNFFQRSV